jgi:hypothetical protein
VAPTTMEFGYQFLVAVVGGIGGGRAVDSIRW